MHTLIQWVTRLGKQRLWRIGSVFVMLVAMLAPPLLPSAAAASTPPATPLAVPWIEPALLQALSHEHTLPLAIIVRLRTQVPFDLSALPPQPQAARAALLATLQAQLARSRVPLEPLLRQGQRSGELWAMQDLWIINALALTANPAFIQRLALHPAVAEIRLDHRHAYLPPQPELLITDTPGEMTTVEWGVARLRAPEVWEQLGISGAGAVVASMDTGVDFQHPALRTNYRGYLNEGAFQHHGAWFDAVNGGLYPYDDHGHGTHTLGTAVGQGGIGVAPGARWIAVKMIASNGYGQNSWIHAGFQWLLAPGGDPALAPDVVICSWGNTNASDETFAPDLALLHAAGIFVVFAAGNEGPSAASLRSPASLPGAFAVGATNFYDTVAHFSSRGPSPWDEIKPTVVAPGTLIRSAVPGGVYGMMNGTSMATPHVAGLGALLRSISATLTLPQLTQLITATTVPLTTTIPNNNTGWGRVDAFAAANLLLHPGWITGAVRSVTGWPLRGAQIQASPRDMVQPTATASTDAEGRYQLALRPTLYDLHAMAFGYYSHTLTAVSVITGTVTQVDFNLQPLPAGEVRGHVTVLTTGEPPTRPVTLHALGTPVTTTVNHEGTYHLRLPTGVYTLEARGNGYRVLTAPITITTESTTWQNFVLEPAPTLLLVDQGALYHQSKLAYWTEALEALRYAYAVWTITTLPLPPALLEGYDIVLWSAPVGSPGTLWEGQQLQTYLENGGRLLLSGQDVAYFDSGSGMTIPSQDYLNTLLGVRFIADDTASRTVIGAGPFSGLTTNIAGGDGANNQLSPDVIAVLNPEIAESVWTYSDNAVAGVAAHLCTPYRGLFWAFGYEGVASAAVRREIMARTLTWLAAPLPTRGLRLVTPEGLAPATPLLIGQPGTVLTHTLRLRHLGIAGPADTATFALSPSQWTTTVSPTQVTLAPCGETPVQVRVTIPPTATVDLTAAVTLTVTSALGAEPVSVTLRTKTPAPVLLVDDDRWFPMEHFYTSALDAAGIRYDVWDTAHHRNDLPDVTSVTPEVLARYPIVIWFTGYDWFDPITHLEEERLLQYLDAGGRLLLSSQDFLRFGPLRPLGERLGVGYPNLDFGVKSAFGVAAHPASGSWGPVQLRYPFMNWSDAPEPRPDAAIVARGQFGQPAALSASGVATGTWRTLFYGLPLETLPATTRATVLQRSVGWLSPLGQSRWEVTPAVPQPGALLTATLTLHNDGPTAMPITWVHHVPLSLTLLMETLPPALHFDAATRQLSWTGTVASAAPQTYRWQLLAPATPLTLTPTVTFTLPTLKLQFTRETQLRVGDSDTYASTWHPVPPVPAGSPITLTFVLRNDGFAPVTEGILRLWLMPGLAPLTATVVPTRGLALQPWAGSLAAGDSTTITVAVQPQVANQPVRVDALFAEGNALRWERSLWFTILPHRLYLPLILRRAP